nr:60S ribosomal protein L10-like [Aotus nancymaae]
MRAQHAMAANSSFLGSVMQPISCMGCTKGPWRQAFQMFVHVSDLALPLCRLQTGRRGAFGKPQGTVAGVHTGQVIMSIHTKLQNKEHVMEALYRAKFKLLGHQKSHISKKWGFTNFNADEFEDMATEKRLIPDGCGVKYIPNHGPLDKWQALHS